MQDKSIWKQLYGWIEQLSGRNFTGCPLSTLHGSITKLKQRKIAISRNVLNKFRLSNFLDSDYKFPASFDISACANAPTGNNASSANKTTPTANEEAPTSNTNASPTRDDAPTIYVQIEIQPAESSGHSAVIDPMLESTQQDTTCYEVKKKKPKGSQLNVLLRKKLEDHVRRLKNQKGILTRQTKRIQRQKSKILCLRRNEKRLNRENNKREKIIEELKKEKGKSSCRNCLVLESENFRLQQEMQDWEQDVSQSDVTNIIFDGYKYTDPAMKCVLHLVDENVGIVNVKPVMQHVLELVGKTTRRLPNQATVSDIIKLRKQNILNRDKIVVREENTTRVSRHEHQAQILLHDHSYPGVHA